MPFDRQDGLMRRALHAVPRICQFGAGCIAALVLIAPASSHAEELSPADIVTKCIHREVAAGRWTTRREAASLQCALTFDIVAPDCPVPVLLLSKDGAGCWSFEARHWERYASENEHDFPEEFEDIATTRISEDHKAMLDYCRERTEAGDDETSALCSRDLARLRLVYLRVFALQDNEK